MRPGARGEECVVVVVVVAMPSPTSACLMRPVRMTRSRRAGVFDGADVDDFRFSGSGGGPLRTRRRLTRAQRQLERRAARASAWLRSEEGSGRPRRPERQEPRRGEPNAERGSVRAPAPGVADPRLPPSDESSSSSSSEASSPAAPTPGPGARDDEYDDGDPKPPPRLTAAPLGARDLNSTVAHCTGAMTPCISASSAPYITSKDALHQRLMLLRRRDGLIDITIRTYKLMQRNQQLQTRLKALQAETRAFVKSVLNNPENRALRVQQLQNGDATAPSPIGSSALCNP